MRKIIQLLVLIGFGSVLMLNAGKCFAGIEPNQNNLTGPFANGASYTTQDNKFSDPNWSTYLTNSIQSTVALKVMDNVLISAPFTYTVNLQIQYKTAPGSSVTTLNTSLTVNYTPGQGVKYKGLDVINVPNAVQIIVTVTSSSATGTVPTSAVQLNTAIVIDRSYPFTAGANIGAAYTMIDSIRQLKLVLASPLASADEYDVEWTTINNGNSNFTEISNNASVPSSPDNTPLSTALANAFLNNSSRITTKAGSFSLSTKSTDSIMLVRIRQVQYNRSTGVRVAGNWDYKNGTGYAIWRLKWDEQNQNWQYSAAFAEDGKKKEVVSYFDGTLRGRQTVTLNNTDTVAIAQENVYDDFGRPTASILPAPFKQPTGGVSLHFIPNFNLNAASLPYTFANVVGAIAAACEFNPDPLKTSSGASRYYSGQNAFLGSNKPGINYVPDAAGFPISVTQYTGDNTGRIKSQGGVGAVFQPGKSGGPAASKTTKYYYGKPEQWELDQLFANDAGYAENYLKNMVIDPNGQVSISYLNASGKTVATALTGTAPSMLDTIPSYHTVSRAGLQNIHILKPEQFIYNSSALMLNANTTYLSSVTGTDTLKFSIQRLVDKYPGTFTICSNCYYKMTAVVSDDCGDIVANISTPVKIGDTVATCGDTTLYTGSLIVPVNQIGEYNVSIQFAFDNNVIQSYTDAFITQGLAHGYIEQQFDYIKKRYLDSLNLSGCYSDCHTCETLLGGQADFVQMLQVKCTSLGLDPVAVADTSFTSWGNRLYSTLKTGCDALQSACMYSPCTDTQNLMVADVSPGGQYALFDATGTALEPEINVLTEISPGKTDPNWRVEFPKLPATDSVYISHEVTLPDGSVVSPNDASFTILDLITYWQPAWGINFLKYHPEYCQLKFCIRNQVYESWDMRLQQDFIKASQVPSIPTSGSPLHYSHTNAADWLVRGDPFFNPGGAGNAYVLQMQSDLTNYSSQVMHTTGTAVVKGLIVYDDYLLYCADKTGNTNIDSLAADNWTNCVPNDACRVADREWTTYRDNYLQLKQKYYDLLRADSCGSICPVGQPIVSGIPGGCPMMSDFSIQTYAGTPTCTGGSQTAVITYNPGTLSQLMTVQLYYPSAYNSVPGLTRSLSLFAGTSQQTFCVPAGVPISVIKINKVYCGNAPDYGNDSTWVVHITDAADPTGTNDCKTLNFAGGGKTTVTLTDAAGNPVNAVNSLTVTINYSRGDIPDIEVPFFIDAGQNSASLRYQTRGTVTAPDENCPWEFHCVFGLFHVSNFTGATACSGFSVNNPQPPPPGPCPVAYTTKTSRFATYSSIAAGPMTGTDSAQLIGPTVAAIQAQAASICDANAATWIGNLQPGLTAMSATPTQIANLTNAFISICSQSGDQTHPMGASTLPPGLSSPYAGFGPAIQSILLGGGHYTALLNPWLISSPYPYSPPQQSVTKTISNSSAALCTILHTDSSLARAAGKTLYNYLVDTYGNAMTLSLNDLDSLQKSCKNCRFILGSDVTLPVFLDPGSQGCVMRSAYITAKADMNTAFGNTLSITNPNYENILSNYMNQKWGFSLTYDNYAAFEVDSAGLLCNTLPYATKDADPYDCVKNGVSTAVISGLADYNNYIALQRQIFRASYINTCKLAQANANLEAVQQEYHYTLYYYDQADNLVRTVPPEGVTLVDNGLFSYIDRARNQDTTAISYTYNGPRTTASLPAAMTTLSTTLSGGHGAIEMWLYNKSLNHYHWVEATPDNQYIFNTALAGNVLNIDVYPTAMPAAGSYQLLPITGHYQVDLTPLLPLFPFTHVVMQGDSLGKGTKLPQIYVNGKQLAVNTNGTPAPFGFTVTAGTSTVTLPDSIQSLKHLLLYDHVLSTHTIQTDAANLFFSASDLTYLGWYRFNIPAAGAPPTTVNGTTDETSLFDTYPAHVIATSYVYNSTNQVSSQQSPDGGSNSYWYDLLSRLVFSQNSKQSAGSNWSYTTYDLLGRISEVGQKQNPTGTLGNPDYLQNTTINTFYGQGSNSQITHTYYDSPVPTVAGNTDGIATLPGQQNLRKRVAASTYTETQGSPALRATYYNYDIDGNVKTLWQQVDGLYQNSTNTGLKRIDYEYDLVSGKVNFVSYQNGQPDAFYYQYNYDADNRLTQAWSGTTAITDTLTHSTLLPNNKKRDAAYRYYLHGPLQRMELGDSSRQVQGVDYAYTLQGWLKGVNSTAVQSSMDMGRDSLPIPRDAYGYALYYYNGDYTPISGTNPFANTPSSLGTFNGLYNGNIAASSMNIPQLADPWHYYTYRYDQLNRIKATNVYKVNSSVTQVTDYNEAFTYDGNGNILSAIRNKGAAAAMDSLTYNYNHSGGRLTSNRLNYVSNKVTANNYPFGVAGQSLNNYTYDAIGNMTADVRDTISAVNWTVYGKIQNLTNAKGLIAYTYDPAGQRVSQTVNGVTTWYIRDAQGNALALYDNKQSSINWKEQELYGSSRLGLWQPRLNLTTGNETASWDTTGKKNFELSNHLGNVLATLTDNRIQHSTNGTSIDYFNADINTANEYYTFGGLMAGRTFTQGNNYRYGFNGKENDNDVQGVGNQQDYGMRIYDPKVGRFLSVDPLSPSYPELTPYQFSSNSPIVNIDLDGLEATKSPKNVDYYQYFVRGLANGLLKQGDDGVAFLDYLDSKNGQQKVNEMARQAMKNPVKWLQQADKTITDKAKKEAIHAAIDAGKIALEYVTGSKKKASYESGEFVAKYGVALLTPETEGATTLGEGAMIESRSLAQVVKTNNIMFSQQSVNELSEIVSSMRSKGWSGPPIDVVELEGGKFGTLDNTRVLAAHEAGIDVNAIVHKQSDLLTPNEAERFTTKKGGTPKTWGDAYKNRIGKQSAAYKRANPNGSYTTGGSN